MSEPIIPLDLDLERQGFPRADLEEEDPAERAEIAGVVTTSYKSSKPMIRFKPPGRSSLDFPTIMDASNGRGEAINLVESDADQAVFSWLLLVLAEDAVSEAAADAGDSDAEREHREIKGVGMALGASIKHKKQVSSRRRSAQLRLEVITIKLRYDSGFLTLPAQASAYLMQLFRSEKQSFMEAVRALAQSIKKNVTPVRGKSDLHAWREGFSIWVEAGIFEGESERDQGKRSIQEVEKRLDLFVDQVTRRKLAKRMRKKGSRISLERFVELNQRLLQCKR